ncbi:MAG TPA: glycosyltransferase family 2 protein [Chloroflexia bacterium]|nr:glycosyltransferase family 2 protein [Chloroflexia bacterium]
MIQSNISDSPLQGEHRPTPDVSIIIVSWNVRPLLERCLSLLTQGAATGDLVTEIIVVDNASSDGSADVAASFPNVHVVRCEHNLGYGRANNIGMKMARGKHLLVLNPDTEPLPGSIERLVAFQRSCPSAGIVAPRLLNVDRSVQASAFSFPTLAMAAIDLFPLPHIVPGRLRQRLYSSRLNGRYPDEGKRDLPFRIDHPLGACMLISRQAYREVGGFDPKLFIYSEEIDLALRYLKAGWECWQVPQAEVVHIGGQSTGQIPDRMFVHLWRSRLYLYRKHYPLAGQLALSLLLVLAQLRDIISVPFKRLLRQIEGDEAKRALIRALKAITLVFTR